LWEKRGYSIIFVFLANSWHPMVGFFALQKNPPYGATPTQKSRFLLLRE